MKSKVYAIRMANGFWYESHGKWNGMGCIQSSSQKFPTTFYGTKGEASRAIDRITRDYPDEGVECAIVSITFTMSEVFADISERSGVEGTVVAA